MAAAHILRFSPLPSASSASGIRLHTSQTPSFPFPPATTLSTTAPSISLSLCIPRAASSSQPLHLVGSGGDGGNITGGGGSGSSGGGDGFGSSDGFEKSDHVGPIGFFVNGWRSRVAADPQFPFKVLMEEIVGVSSCVLGDMASRPNFGLNELDFVFSTLVVGSILNFVLMYLLAPTAASAAASSALPGIFSSCPAGHMFESGAYSFFDRLGTFAYKGAVFGAVGFAAGLVGTAISNGLISLRKKMDPEFETANKPPPTLLNALTWSIHMGLSSNLRYQSLNGLEFLLAKVLPPALFKANVIVLRCANNVLGGVSFVALARMTGSQKVEEKTNACAEVKEKLISDATLTAEEPENGDTDLQRSEAESICSSK